MIAACQPAAPYLRDCVNVARHYLARVREAYAGYSSDPEGVRLCFLAGSTLLYAVANVPVPDGNLPSDWGHYLTVPHFGPGYEVLGLPEVVIEVGSQLDRWDWGRFLKPGAPAPVSVSAALDWAETVLTAYERYFQPWLTAPADAEEAEDFSPQSRHKLHLRKRWELSSAYRLVARSLYRRDPAQASRCAYICGYVLLEAVALALGNRDALPGNEDVMVGPPHDSAYQYLEVSAGHRESGSSWLQWASNPNGPVPVGYTEVATWAAEIRAAFQRKFALVVYGPFDAPKPEPGDELLEETQS